MEYAIACGVIAGKREIWEVIVTNQNRDVWHDVLMNISTLSPSLNMESKDRLIALMEHIYAQSCKFAK